MSPQLINRNPDLARLVEDGYEVSVRSGHLCISGVPYVNCERRVRLGTLVSDLGSISGDRTVSPVQQHVVMFAGEYPCDPDGRPLVHMSHVSADKTLGPDLVINHAFSKKPAQGYRDYHHKVTTYVAMIERHAQAIDPNVSARTHRVIANDDPDVPFVYPDTASGRVGISDLARKLELSRVGIFGLGGTGSYILDLVAKTPVREIALFDGDTFLQHNAFRAPGAASIDDLRSLPKKVDYFAALYGRMHKGIVTFGSAIDATNIDEIGPFDFAFIAMDAGKPKRLLVEHLERSGTPFVDVGMGVELVDGALTGLVQLTTSTPERRDHVHCKGRISFRDGGRDNLYTTNIQVADLNALNACLAVIRWKKLFGFYHDLGGEHYATYRITSNILGNEDEE